MIRTTGLCLMLSLAAPAAFAQTAAEPMSSGGAATAEQAGTYQVFFGLDSATLDTDALATVTAAANEYRRTGTANVTLSGHTDTTGSASYNQALAQRRADAVAQELVRLGVPQTAIAERDEGESDLLVQTGEDVPERRNRRVEIALQQPPAPAAAEPAPMAVAAPAEPSPPPEEEDNGRFSLGGYYGLNLLDEGRDDGRDDGTSNLAGLNLSFDYLLTDWLNLSLEQAGFYNFGTDDDGFGGRSAAGLDFVFPVGDEGGFSSFSSFLPYVGANIGYIYGSGIDDDFFAGPEIGLNIGPFNAKIAYDIPWDRGDLGEGIISTTIGLGFTF